MDLSKAENWKWLIDVLIWLQHTPPLISFVLIMIIVFGGYALWAKLDSIFKYEIRHDIDLPFGIKIKGTRRVTTVSPRLAVVCRLGAQSADSVQVVFFIENTGAAPADQILCNLFDNPNLKATAISREDDSRSRQYNLEMLNGTQTFGFREDTTRVLHPNSWLTFASAFINRSVAPFNLQYRIRATDFDDSGTVLINPTQLTQST
jgi:hypothetical protein